MINTTTRGRMLASSILVGAAALAFAAPAFAQTAPQPSGADRPPIGPSPASVGSDSPPSTGGQEVVVTGSRIRQPNLTSTSPLTVVNHQELVFQGTTNVESLLNNLPSVTANQTSQVSNGSNGTAVLNLRNLGPLRTLVLVDGKRLVPGDSQNGGSADINFLPPALVDRVDVVTGGASAVYGSDAVAGVVNFIMKKNFEGLRIDAQTSFYNHQNGNDQAKSYLGSAPYLTGAIPVPSDVDGDGWIYDVSAILGANSPDDKGNITTYADYRHLTPVLQGTRDYSACAVATSGNTNNTHVCSGSSNTAYGRFDNTGAKNPVTGRGTAVRANNPDGTNTFVSYPSSGALSYNFNPVNYLQREDDTYRAGYFGHYKFNDKVDVYSDFMFMRDQTDAQIAPSGFFNNIGPNLATAFTFNCNNPLIGASQAAALCPGSVITPGAAGGDTTTTSIRYRFATAPRNTDFVHEDFKIDLGVRGDLGQGWHYDAYLQYGRSDTSNTTTNYASLTRLQDALNVVNNAAGQPVCASGTTGCVPLNIFTSLGRGFTKEALAYVLVPAFQTGSSIEQVAHADISGDFGQYGVKSPLATDGLGVAFGTEYRRENIQTNFDAELQTGDLSGAGAQQLPVQGSFDVYELFGEARLPLIQNMPFVKDLSIDVGYRFSDYSSVGKTDTYKAEANYSPTQDIRARFSYNRAVRAPSAIELFAPQISQLGAYQDPCTNNAGATPQFTQAQCARTGLNPALYGVVTPCASAQCEIQTSGNTALTPEVADTYSIGLVLTPRFLRGFTASIDYFNISVNKVITTGAPPSTILSGCASGNDFYCSLIHRDAQGTINSPQGFISQINQNSGQLQTRGIDFTANYRLPFSTFNFTNFIPGALNFDLVGTWTEDLTFQPLPLGGHYNCAGLYGPECGVPQPHWRGSFRTTWLVNSAINLSANVRYTGRVKLDYNNGNPLLNGNGTDGGFLDLADGKISGYYYLDLAATYRFKDRYTFRVGVNNILDKDPPIIDSNGFGISAPPYGNANTFPGVYDSLGRQIFMGVTADF